MSYTPYRAHAVLNFSQGHTLILDFFLLPWRQRGLIGSLTRREVEARYRGSFLGFGWSVLLPLMSIGIYSFVFGTLVQARWQVPSSAPGDYSFAMLLFGPFIAYTIFAESIGRAPTLILDNTPYVKKVVFPLEVLCWVTLYSALFNAAVAFLVFIGLFIVLYGLPSVTILLLPFAVLPIALISLAALFFLSSIGVFLRDIRQIVPLLTTAFLFLSPVFFPLEAIPEAYRPLMYLNPLTLAVGHIRDVIFWGTVPPLGEWALYALLCLSAAVLGYLWFMRTKKAFADVL
ncbi:ABC transporter permease [Aureimonas glaciei]|uniref:Transport permease protein n=1 Tax=Aureimonas glaciei TaxID=1776957 RepID=A0A916XW27_9HYPH|nr:ABC transporter permease [Aureimonas glaciei]GGD14252.1 transport permease protein [Aureimonas glaciei]